MRDGQPHTHRATCGVVFDLDGLLVDSEPVQKMSFNVVLGPLGIELSDDDFQPLVGHSTQQNFLDLKDRYGIKENVESLLQRKAAAYQELIDTHMTAMPGAGRLLGELRAQGVPVAVASSSTRRDVDRSLAAVGLDHCVDFVVAGDEVRRSKPAPDLYLEAARGLGLVPGRCVALEDSNAGVQAAHAAGIPCIAVPNLYTRGQAFEHAVLVVDSLVRLTARDLVQLVDPPP